MGTSRCPHRCTLLSEESKTYLLLEHDAGQAELAHRVQDASTRESGPTGRYEIVCQNCNVYVAFTSDPRSIARLPRWARRAWEDVQDARAQNCIANDWI